MDCNHYDNWCEKEKRTCNNCYYERGDNMSDDEKIKQLENKLKKLEKENQALFELYNFNDASSLAKELQDLKDIQQQICNEELFSKEYVDKNYIHKDVIRRYLEIAINYNELNPYDLSETNGKVIRVLKEILEQP